MELYFLDMNLEAISHSRLIKVAKLKRKKKKEYVGAAISASCLQKKKVDLDLTVH